MKNLISPKQNARRVLRVSRGAKRRVKEYLSVGKNYKFNIDNPRSKVLDKREVTVEGWIVSKNDTPFQVRIKNNSKVYPVELGVRRVDVAKSYPEIPESKSLHSGFEKEIVFEEGTLSIEINEGKGFKKLATTEVRFSLEHLPSTLYNKDLSNNYPEHINLLENRQKIFYEDRLVPSYKRDERDPRTVAIYLPQFHPFAENNKAWGLGFTEWSNVSTGQARFVGHQQPILPKDLGFYDLRTEGKLLEQIDLAKKYGVYGFCFYYYWFSGKKLMEGPINELLEHKEWDFNFTICWANENWTKRWDGRDSEVIIAQEYREEDPIEFIKEVEHILLDERYITEDGKPVLMVYRASELKEPKKYAQVWRDYFREKHGKELQLVTYLSFDDNDPRKYGFDAAVDFAPHSAFFKHHLFKDSLFPYLDVKPKLLDINFEGMVADYRSIALNDKLDFSSDFPVYPCVTPSWDNDSRKKGKGFVYQNSSPDIYAAWLDRIVEKSANQKKAPLVFINAWNEWAEGAIMEPSVHLGHAVLNRTAEVLSKHSFNKENAKNFPSYEVKKPKGKKLAVVIHLYYTDLWAEISEKLKNITVPYDVFITLNARDADFIAEVDNPNVTVYSYVIPNRGRDVLPFLYIARRVSAAGYEYVLKIHSKKSKHRKDGSNWFSEVLNGLLPSEEIVSDVVEKLGDKSTALIGPENHLVSLRRHMGGNWPILENLIMRSFDKESSDKVSSNRERYPYVGGTMFWARVDAIQPILDLHLLPDDFQSEHGQIDGTSAHAVERLFGVVAGLEAKKIYTISVSSGGLAEAPAELDEKYKYAP